MRIGKSRPERIPRDLSQRVRQLAKRGIPDFAAAEVADEVRRKVGALGQGADPAASIAAYIAAHRGEWAARIAADHNELLSEIALLAADAHALAEERRIRYEDQRDLVEDLDAAVAHALERVTDPDAPYHEPGSRSERRGGKR